MFNRYKIFILAIFLFYFPPSHGDEESLPFFLPLKQAAVRSFVTFTVETPWENVAMNSSTTNRTAFQTARTLYKNGGLKSFYNTSGFHAMTALFRWPGRFFCMDFMPKICEQQGVGMGSSPATCSLITGISLGIHDSCTYRLNQIKTRSMTSKNSCFFPKISLIELDPFKGHGLHFRTLLCSSTLNWTTFLFFDDFTNKQLQKAFDCDSVSLPAYCLPLKSCVVALGTTTAISPFSTTLANMQKKQNPIQPSGILQGIFNTYEQHGLRAFTNNAKANYGLEVCALFFTLLIKDYFNVFSIDRLSGR